jgi:hypothetical protein
MRRLAIAALLAGVIAGAAATSAGAAPTTGRLRTLDCGSFGTVEVELGPAALLTTTAAAVHVVGTGDVLLPRRVEVTTPEGSTFVTLDTPIAASQASRAVTCSYVDPAGLRVTLTALVTPRTP